MEFLEIGPKHGEDTRLLSRLAPSRLVLIDLPDKRNLVNTWLPEIPVPTTLVEGNLLYLPEENTRELGQFDLVWCLGVLYHNAEQLRLLRMLFKLCRPGGKVVVESATTRNRKLQNLNVVEIHWPSFYRDLPTITHMPSRLAIKSWLEMVGFSNVTIHDLYSRGLAKYRAVLSGVRDQDAKPYTGYGALPDNPPYIPGESQ
jgi:SAM-dependent methyltransferase